MHVRALFFSLTLFFASCRAPDSTVVRFEGQAMGTNYRVQVTGNLSESERLGVSRLVKKVLEDVDRKMSTYRPDSELSQINDARARSPIRVSSETFAVFEEALRVSGLTEGTFDVTVGPLVRLWGFGAEGRPLEEVPSDEAIGAALRLTGYRHLILDDDPPSVAKDLDGVTCDLSGIAKGYSVDRVAEALEARGHRNYMVEVGGEVRTEGKNGSGEAWRIAIEKPLRGQRALQRVVPLSGLAMATSGDYRDFHELGGKFFSHLIDPRSGRPVAHNLASVSVIGESCMRADALASGLLVLGPEEGYDLAVREDLTVLFLVRNEDGEIQELATPSFRELFFDE